VADKRLFKIHPGVLNRFSGSSEHRMGHSKSGVFHGFLFSKLGRMGMMSYVADLKRELGVVGFGALIERFSEEVPEDKSVAAIEDPEPEQLEIPMAAPRDFTEFPLTVARAWEMSLQLLGFTRTVDKTHPGAAAAAVWKATNKMRFVLFDKLKAEVGDQPVVYSAKMDGELVCLWYEEGKGAVVVTHKGTVRKDLPALDQATERLARRYKRAVLMGEFYAVDDQGRPVSYMRAAHTLRNPRAGEDEDIRIAVFDILELDGKSYEDVPTLDKMRIVRELFAGATYVHPALTERGTIHQIESLWNELDKRGLEGIVVHQPDGTLLKSKPILSFDLVVVAVSKSHTMPGRIGAVLTSFIDKEGRFRLAGNVGTGLTDEQRIQFLEWAKSIALDEDETYIWVDPKKSFVVEVEAVEVHPKEQPAFRLRDGHYVEVEDMMAGSMRFPVIKQIRDDKDPKYLDVRVEQLPFQTSVEATLRPPADGALRKGQRVRVISGQIGTIVGDDGQDVLVEWDAPLWGLARAEVRQDAIVEVTG
jgi:hypothetical protein